MRAVNLDDHLRPELAALDDRGLRRAMRPVDGPQGARVRVEGAWALNFSSNNYLGLADHPYLRASAVAALSAEGVGAGAARLIVGNLSSHRRLERALAAFHEVDAALLFGSGYQANLGVLGAVAGPEDIIYSDALNHASLIDGCRLSRATTHVFQHRDVGHLRQLLLDTRGRRRFIITDSIFSMDGDLAPLSELRRLADEHQAFLLIDEAHATGVLGPAGRGLAAASGVRADIHIATLGKALGATGAYVAGSRILIDHLMHRARSFVFTTAGPPSMAAAAMAAIGLASGVEGDARRAQLRANITAFAHGLRERGLLAAAAGQSPIFPVMLPDEHRALKATARLLAQGVYAQAIRPPTVPTGTSRLRFSVMSTHSADDLAQALAAIDDLRAGGLL